MSEMFIGIGIGGAFVLVIASVLWARHMAKQNAALREQLAAPSVSEKSLPLAAIKDMAEEPPEPACASCAHFDLAEGQALMSMHPAFSKAASHLRPAQMVRSSPEGDPKERAENTDNRGNPDMAKAPPIPYKASWNEFGACHTHDEGRWMYDKCDKYQFDPKVAQQSLIGVDELTRPRMTEAG